MRVSAVVICWNEEADIAECLESVKWCDEIVVVDSESTDRTVEIARRYTDRVIVRPWPGFVAQKNFALEQATGDWILSVDADERCTPGLPDEIKAALAGAADDVGGFSMKRHVWYMGRWINHGGWYPDRKVRLVRRGRARWTGTDPHDKLEADGRVEKLKGELVHFTYRDLNHQLQTMRNFSDVAAAEWVKAGKKFCLFKAIFHPPLKFLECYVWKLGFLDGWPGFVIAAASAFYVRMKYVKLWERTRHPAARPPEPPTSAP